MTLRLASRAIAVFASLAMLAAACGDDGGEAADRDGASPTTTGEPRSGGTLVMAVFAEPSGLDPVVPQGGGTGGNHELGAIYDTLMRWDGEEREYVPQLAESLTPNDDFTEWTLQLRPDVVFSDGTPFDAEAVVFGIRRHTQYGSTLAGQVASISDYDVVDDRTVVFTLRGPWPNFAFLLSHTPGMIPSPTAVRAACPDPDQPARDCPFNTNPVGAGPFVVESYRPREALVLSRNPDYWGGDVHLDGLRFVPPQAAGLIYDQVKSGAVHVAFLREAAIISRATDEGTVDTHTAMQGFGGIVLLNNGQITCRNGLPAAVCAGQPDGIVDLDKPTGDVRVRQAIAHAIDPEQLDLRMNEGKGFPGSEFFHSESTFATGPSAEYDPDRARALVEEVKRERNWDGSLSVSCLQEQATGAPFVQTVQALLNTVGFNVTTELRPATEYITRIQATRDYDIACWGFNVSEEAPESGLSRHVLSVAGGNAGGNAMNLNNPQIDAEIVAIRQSASESETQAALDRLLAIWRTEQPSVVYSNNAEMIASGRNVHGLRVNVATSVMFDQAWIG